MSRLAPPLGLERVLAAHPAEALQRFAARAPGWRVIAQQGADLSARMEHAAASELARGAARVLLRGSDAPALGASQLAEALAALARSDVALSPDPDGGYGLVALRRFAPGLFAHAMSTRDVLRETRAAADLARLRAVRAAGEPLCPRTLAWLDAHPELS
jgi:glycosyltransferase A (GT-A) superfamily protein (DUF2064 family)